MPNALRLSLSGFLVAAAISSSSPASNPSDLNSLIDGLQRKYARMQGIAADFTQTYQGPDGRFLKESGRVLLKRPRKARWDYSLPERKVFLSDGKDIYFYVYGEKEATKAPIRESADPQIPFLFLLGQGNLRRDFARIEAVADVQPAAAGDTVLKLIPKRAPEDFKELLAEVDPGSFEVRRLVIFGRNGSRMDFLLTNVHENFIAPDSDFIFTAPPGVIIRRAG
jgi:outer membrane lipoprotein carrier protein